MLVQLRIQDFALIDFLEVQFQGGLNVLTGETGAGKSIILDAIDVVLGGKANQRMIRTGSDRALIEAMFTLDPPLRQWLASQEIDLLDEEQLTCSREIANGGNGLRSRCRVNGVLVNLQTMEQLRDRLAEITAQGQTSQIMQPSIQREFLDLWGGLHDQLGTVAEAYRAAQAANLALEKRCQSQHDHKQRLELLRYQSQELRAANLSRPEELAELQHMGDRLSHVVELQRSSYQLYQMLYQNDQDSSVADILGQAQALLADMVGYDQQLQPILDLVASAAALVVEAGSQINAYGADLESDPEQLQQVNERIQHLKQICRKYGPDLADAIAHWQKIEAELRDFGDEGQSIDELIAKQRQTQAHLESVCADLTRLRSQAAETLETALISQLRPLAMDKVQFQVQLQPTTPTAVGADLVEFYFSPNPGEPSKPLAETASGGEMSRFLLALKACLQTTGQPTLIFDEIDVGVSGKVAQAIADKLHTLAQRQQVLCITHQPLVAAMADQHLKVDKQLVSSKKNATEVRTVVRVRVLDNWQQRREELAQLAGGQADAEALQFAQALLEQAAERRTTKMPEPIKTRRRRKTSPA
jgi:DNA repair protein RecN (Recombination protein N)